ncbi:MAG TPA: WhiB family transcriptional regulator [Acidimicrobiales bacterium]
MSNGDPADRYDLPSLDELAHRPAWQRDADCREHPGLSWFEHADADACAAICARCLVRVECGATANANGERFGVWAGEDRGARGVVRSRRAVA